MNTVRRLLVLAALALPLAGQAQLDVPKRDPLEHFFHPFLGDLKAELDEAKGTGRKGVLVMFHFDDCPACLRMKRDILAREDVQRYFRQHFVIVPIDTKGAIEITDFAGARWVEKDFARAVPVVGTPTFVFYGMDGRPMVRHVGEIRDPREFLLLGEFVASGDYRSQTFAQYKQGLSSRRKN